jgi:fatty acid desaturase
MSDRRDDEETYRQIIAGLLEDGEQFAKSRIKLYRAIVLYRVAQARKAALLIVTAILITAAALVALLMALVFSLSQSVGPLWAGVIVSGVGLITAGLLAYWGVKTFPDLDEKLFEDDEFDIAPVSSPRNDIHSHEAGEGPRL